MSNLLAVLIFGVGYPIVALVVACVGVFGIAATGPDRRKAAYQAALAQYRYVSIAEGDTRWRYGWSTFGLLVLTLLAGCLWPVAIPLWFAWRKGSFIADALEKRDEQQKLDAS